MSNKKGSKRKVGSGRKAGSFSFVTVPLSSLNNLFKDPEVPVIVSRLWCEQVGIKDAKAMDAGHLHDSIQGTTPSTAVSVKAEEL